MKRLIGLVALAAAAIATAAPSACVQDTAFGYNNLGYPKTFTGDGCTLGSGPNELTLVAFNWFTNSPTASHPEFVHFSDSDVIITPNISGAGKFLGLTFAPGPALGGIFTVPAGKVMAGELHYIVDPPPPIIDGFGMTLDPTGPSQMNITLIVGQKVGDQTIPSSPQTLTSGVISKAAGDLDFVFPPFGNGVTCCNYIDVTVDFTIGNQSTTAPVTSGGGTATIITTESIVTPEPAAYGLVGIGLVGLGLLRRRAKV